MPLIDPSAPGARTYRPPKPKPKPKPKPTPRVVKVKAHPHVEVHIHVQPNPDQRIQRSPQQLRHDAGVVAQNVRESRLKVLRKRHRGAGVRQVKKELEGRGVLAKGSKSLANRASQGGLGSSVPKHPVRATRSEALPGAGGLLQRGVKDLVNLPAQVIPSVYVPAAGVVEAAKGRPQRLNRFRHDVAKNDPYYNLGAAGVAKVRGQDKQAKLHLGRAKKDFSEHPGYALAEAYGLKGGAGRGAGRVMRSGVVGKRAKQAASTVRAPKVQPGTSLRMERRYSPDVFRKAEQVNAERRLRRQSQQAGAQAKLEANPERRAELEQKARRTNPDLMQERDIVTRVDKNVAAMEAVRRRHRAQTVNETRKLVKPVRKAGPITSLVTQRIADANLPDLRAYLDELKAEHPNLGPVAQRANVTMRHHLAKAIKAAEKGKVNLSDVQRVADEYAARNTEASRGLVTRGMLDAEQAERRVVMPYAVRKMGAEHAVIGGKGTLRMPTAERHKLTEAINAVQDARDVLEATRLEKAGKDEIKAASVRLADAKAAVEEAKPKAFRDLPTWQIYAHMGEHGGERPGAYINQGPNQRGAGNFYRSSHQPPKISRAQFTGKATRGGSFDAHPDTLVEASARTQTLKDQFDHFQNFLREFAHKNPKGRGGYLTRNGLGQAQKLADELTLAHGIPFRAIPANPLGGSKEQLHAMLEGDTSKPNTVTDAIQAALDGKGSQGPWAIVPEVAAKRMQEHVRLMAPGNAGRVARHASSLFRQSVLATSPKWFVNNAVEAGFRSAFARAGPRSYITGRRYLREVARIDPKNAEYVQARTVGGGHYAMAERQRIHMDTQQFTDGAIKDVARHMSAFWRLPGPHHAANLWSGWTHFVFNTANAYIEHQFQTGMLGKAVRDQLMPGELRKLSEKAIRDAAAGHHDTGSIVALGDAVDRMYGKYDKFTPGMKQAIALYTPFVAWALNAAYFVLRTLPEDHPTALALLASTERATEEWRKQHGLDEFVKGRVPGFLQGSIPGPKNTKFRAPNNSLPFGAFSDVPNTAASAVLPQLSGVLSSFEGRDWKGKELRDKHGQPIPETQKALVAASQFLQSTIPALAIKQQVQKGISGQAKSITGYTKPPKRKVKQKRTAARSIAPDVVTLNSAGSGSSDVTLNSGGSSSSSDVTLNSGG